MPAIASTLSPFEADCEEDDETASGLVSISCLQYFAEIIEERGGSVAAICRSVGVRPDILDNIDGHVRLSYEQCAALMSAAAQAVDCPDFGMRLAARQAPRGTSGPYSVGFANAPTVGEALQFGVEKCYAVCDRVRLKLAHDAINRRWIYHYELVDGAGLDNRHEIERVLLGMSQTLRHISGEVSGPTEVWMRHRPMAQASSYRSYFRETVLFGSPLDALVFDEVAYNAPVIHRDHNVYEMVLSYLGGSHLGREESISERVKASLLTDSRIIGRSIAETAQKLGMHERTLQRRLRDEGTRYEVIKDDVCRERALAYLADTKLPLGRIAAALGYSDVSCFSRKCKNWFRDPPRKLRRDLQQRSLQ